jgi:hypothetical protein
MISVVVVVGKLMSVGCSEVPEELAAFNTTITAY